MFLYKFFGFHMKKISGGSEKSSYISPFLVAYNLKRELFHAIKKTNKCGFLEKTFFFLNFELKQGLFFL